MVQVLEKNLEQLKEKLAEMKTNLNKIDYLESAFKKEFSIDAKRFILDSLAELYEKDLLYEKAAKVISNRSVFEITFKEKIESSIKAADFFCKTGKIEDAEAMFSRAVREANEIQRKDILRRRKEMYFRHAEQLEKDGRRSKAMKFYEKLINIKLEEPEKFMVKERLAKTYRLLGRFKDADMIEKI
jgi:tetratricopeptide (TPR) repeat protein